MVSLLVIVWLVVSALVSATAISLLAIGLFFFIRRAGVFLRKGSSNA